MSIFKHDNLVASWLLLGLVYSEKGGCSYRGFNDIDRQIELVKKNNISSAVVVFTLGLNEDSKELYIAGSHGEKETGNGKVQTPHGFVEADYLIRRLQEENIKIELIKVHFNINNKTEANKGLTTDQWLSKTLGSLNNFAKLYHAKILEIAERYKGVSENFCPMNEVDWYLRGNYISFCKSMISDLQKMGYKVTASAMGFSQFIKINKDILNMLDFLSVNSYPQGSILGKDCSTGDIIQAFMNASFSPGDFYDYCQLHFPGKPLWITETGPVDSPQAVLSPSNCSIVDKENQTDGYIQAKYIEALMLLYGDKFEKICFWWELKGSKTIELLGGNQ